MTYDFDLQSQPSHLAKVKVDTLAKNEGHDPNVSGFRVSTNGWTKGWTDRRTDGFQGSDGLQQWIRYFIVGFHTGHGYAASAAVILVEFVTVPSSQLFSSRSSQPIT